MKTTLLKPSALVFAVCLMASVCPGRAADYVAHEWGTFTSVQAGDGNLVPWHPLVTTELPKFVYDRSKPTGDPRVRLIEGKDAFLALQRMETPVIYFYSSHEQTLNVTVHFPKGVVTEWYPYASAIGPSWIQPSPLLRKIDQAVEQTGLEPGFKFVTLDPHQGIRESLIQWSDVHILPHGSAPESQVPADGSSSHYYAARQTDANLIRVTAQAKSGTEREKFLFYRGVGSFETPLHVSVTGSSGDSLDLWNRGTEGLHDLFILDVQKSGGTLMHTVQLAAGQHVLVPLGARTLSLSALSESVAAQMRQALQEQGLYPREAAAMVETWRDSWLQEPGLRVLYVLPRKWTDHTLPITLAPNPDQLVRVMVGRAEVIRPHTEQEVLEQVVQFSKPDQADKAIAVEAFRALDLGRFSEPAIRLVADHASRKELSQAAWALLDAASPKSKSFAQN